MTLPAIQLLVPHSGTMSLLDRALIADENSLSAEITIRADSIFYSDNGIGAWVGIEYMAQTIAAYAGYQAYLKNEKVKIGFLLGARCYECYCDVFPLHAVLTIHARCLLQADNGIGSFECSIHDQHKKLLASATVTVFQPKDVDEFLNNVGATGGRP
jgi:predicted hotdog family 3-hydroxylacyl-ACP dehydratase